MDDNYDKTMAARALEDIARARGESQFSGVQLSTMCRTDTWDDGYSVICTGKPWTWRLVLNATEINETPGEVANDEEATSPNIEEAVLSIQGIVLRRNELPPMMDKLGPNSKAARYIRQGLTITGLGTEAFKDANDSIAKIYALFCRNISLKNPLQCASLTSFGEDGTMDAFNRYFAPRKDGIQERDIPFSREVDPTGTLTKMVNDRYIHGEDNVVHYYERLTASNGDHRYPPVAPAKIQVGDIVELQLSMVGIPMRGGDYKLSTLLRSVTLLDGSHTQNAILSRLSKRVYTEPSTTLRRKVGYGDEELAETRAKIARMDIDSAHS